MSRCSQFPPPGYVWKGVCGDDLKNLLEKMKIEATRAMLEKKNEKKRQKKDQEKRKVVLMKKNSPASTLTGESETQNSHHSTSTSHNMNNKRPLSSPARDEHDSHRLIKKHKNNTDSSGASFQKGAEIESQLLRELLLNWIPTRIEHTLTEPGGEDWLFGKSTKNPRNANSTSEPLVYALPYTILF